MEEKKTPEVVLSEDPADVGLGLPGHVLARCADGIDAVEVRIRFDGEGGTRRALRLLTRAVLEVVVAARRIDGVHAPAQAGSNG